MGHTKLIVFDFDGTLVDSRKLIFESNRLVYAEFGLKCPSDEDCLALIGKSLRLALAQLNGPDAPIEQMVGSYERVLPQLRADAAFVEVPFPGIDDLLAELAAMPGVVLAVATGHVSHTIAPALDILGWQKYFATVQCADMAPSKPHPGMLLQALAATGTTAGNAVMVGDTAFDMEMARAAQLDAVGVAWGYHRPDGLLASGAQRVARDVAELRQTVLDAIYRVTPAQNA